MIRFILIVLFLILFFLVSIPVFVLEWILEKKNPALCDRISHAMVGGGFRIVRFLAGVKLTVKGQEYLPKAPAQGEQPQGVLYIPNHRSFFDVVILHPMLPGFPEFLAKKELEHIPFLSRWMRLIHCQFLDREDPRQGLEMIKDAISNIEKGYSVVIFPEGTRNTNEQETELLPFHEGSFKVATRTGCPVIPVALTHTSRIFEDHFPMVRRTEVTVEFLPPIDVTLLDRREQKTLGAQTRELIRQRVEANQ